MNNDYLVDGSRRGDRRFIKDSGSIEDYDLIWAGIQVPTRNAAVESYGDYIRTSSWAVPVGLTEVQSSFTSNTTRVRLSGGTVGESYEVTNTITTNSGQTKKQSIRIRVRDA